MKLLHTVLSTALMISFPWHKADGADPKLTRILKDYDQREEQADPPVAHSAWLKSAPGKEEAAYLAVNYDHLHEMRKYDVPSELARTGNIHVIPLLKKAIADPTYGKSVLSGLFFACHLGKASNEFRKQMAPEVIRWIGKGTSSSSDLAVELLPVMDRSLASETLIKDEYLAKDAPLVAITLDSLNDSGIEVPMSRITMLLESWKVSARDENTEYRIIRGYREAVRAWAFHEPEAAVEFVEKLIRDHPQESENFAEIPLAAARLSDLYDKLCDHSDDPETFARLPEAARIYFAVVYFQADSDNGGISQALGNSTGDHLPLVRKGCGEIGAVDALDYLDWMCKPFGPEGPSTNRDKRNRQMETMKPSYFEQEEQLLDAWVKRNADKRIPSTIWLVNRYAARHASVLRPFVEKVRK